MMDLMNYLPKYWKDIAEMEELQKVIGIEMQNLSIKSEDYFNQLFVSTATWGLDLWKEELGLNTNKNLSYERRREIIKAKMRGTATTTKTLIKNVAESFSNGEVDVIEQYKNYLVQVKFIGTRGIPADLESFKKIIREIIPAHLAIEYIFTYMTWAEFDSYNKTWQQWDNLNLNWKELTEYRG